MAEKRCPVCSAINRANAAFCEDCGNAFKSDAPPSVNTPYQPSNQQPALRQGAYPPPPNVPPRPGYPPQSGYPYPPHTPPQGNQMPYGYPPPNAFHINPNWPVRSKTAAGLFGILLGSFGIHKFYLDNIGLGIVYVLFCWTGIPGIIGLIEGIIYLCTDDYNFQMKHQVRLH